MIQKTERIDAHHDKWILVLQSSTEVQAMQRRLPDPMPPTHELTYRYAGNTLEIFVREIPIEAVAARTDQFARLGLSELRWLADKHGLDLSKAAPGQDGDREAIVAVLRARFPASGERSEVGGQKQPGGDGRRELLVVPDEVRKMSDRDLETRAGELGLGARKEWRTLKRHQRELRVAAGMASIGRADEAAAPAAAAAGGAA